MSGWSNNNRAHVFTWGGLLVLQQIRRTVDFDTAGPMVMTKLDFFSPTDSAQLRRTKATSLAAQLDNIFRLLHGGKFEAGFNATKAIGAMVGVLTTQTDTIETLGETVDDCYQF